MTSPDSVALHVSRRLFAIEGETRINLLRLLAVALFYAVHLVNRYGVGMETGDTIDVFDSGVVVPVFDTITTALVVGWGAVAGAVLLIVRWDRLQGLLAPVTTLIDITFVTILLLIGNAPTSPLVLLFFLIIPVAGLRGRREIVWLATVAALVAYALNVGYAAALRPDLMPPNYHVLFVVTALLMAGYVSDLSVRSLWDAVEQHPHTLQRVKDGGGAELSVPVIDASCPWCGAPAATGVRCPRCQQPLDAKQSFKTARSRSMLQVGPVHLGWVASVVALVALALAVGIGLGIQWPALLVPYIGGTLLLFLALGRLIQVDLGSSEAGKGEPGGDRQGARRTASTLGTAAATVALGAILLPLLLGVLILFLVFVVVVVVALCAAVVIAAQA